MRNAILFVVAATVGIAAAQIPSGTERRYVYQSGRLLAEGIAMTEVVQRNGEPMLHYESISMVAAPNGVPARINSWSLLDGTPVHAEYTAGALKFTADVADGQVRFTSKSGETIVPLPKGKAVFESQIDPLALLKDEASLPIAVIDVVNARVIEATLRDGGKTTLRQGHAVREGRRFRVDSGNTPGWITLDADGSFVSFTGENGLRMVTRRLP